MLEQRAQPALEPAPVEQLGERSCSAWWRSSTSRPRRSETSMTCVSSGPSLSRVKCICAQRAPPSAVSRRTSAPTATPGVRERAGHQGVRPFAVGRVHEVDRGARDQLLRRVPRDRAQRRVDAVEDAGARGEPLTHGGGLERVREAGLAHRQPAAGAARVLQDDGERGQQRAERRARAARSAARGAARRRRPRTPGRRRRCACARRPPARFPACRGRRRRWSRAARRCGAARPGRRRPARCPGTRPRRRRRAAPTGTRGRSRAARARRWSSA